MVYIKSYSLFKRQKLLLAILQVFGGRLSSLDLQKYLFLYTQNYQEIKSYDFVPYKYGCFSFQSYADRRRLIELGKIDSSNEWCLTSDCDHISALDKVEQKKLSLFSNRYANLHGNSLIHYIYKNYPYYAINSEIACNIMNKDELLAIQNARPKQQDFGFFTIGYEGASIENYLNRLIQNNIHVVCDVRNNPVSRKYGFSKTALSQLLSLLGIQYIHIPQLGIISENRQELNTQQDYDRLFDQYEKSILLKQQESLNKLKLITDNNKRVAITCFEAVYSMCHRSRIAKVLTNRSDWHYPIKHI
ncbi:DUF488 domain-containing protein [Commensalibacter nepenthis]|uniref:DUF488 family protein n=1 Tax=Commensalibacter nepenthis TaxID=3043872 RepID=A0ABT6Q8H6_9PROT|nr:DUF488 domain-containing protein [Commensalibacter sp. TBRC 10068]MDI2113086.1 DUF488 family protein [Commensalibacter sp. TBRC 10068]